MTKAASNSSYRYMTVLIQMLAVVSLPVESEGCGGTRSPDAFAQAAGHDDPADLVDFFEFETDDAARRLGGGNGGVALGGLALVEEARRLQILAPDAIGAEIDRSARNQFVTGQDFHMSRYLEAILGGGRCSGPVTRGNGATDQDHGRPIGKI